MLTIVGTESIATAGSTDPEVFTIPVPTGTAIGDLLIVGHHQQEVEITDTRLTPVYGVYSAPNSSGAFGIATDLTDVEVTVNGTRPGIVTVIALTATSAPDAFYADVASDYDLLVRSEQPSYAAAIAFVCDIEDGSGCEVGTDAGWTDQGEVAVYDGVGSYYSIRCLTYDSGAPVPSLTVDEAEGGGGLRSSLIAYWAPPVITARGFLRQRQRPPASRVRQVQSPARVRQVIR